VEPYLNVSFILTEMLTCHCYWYLSLLECFDFDIYDKKKC